MKIKLFLVVISLTNFLNAQENIDKTIYLDSLFTVTSNQNYLYYNVIKEYNLDKEIYKIEQHYRSGKLKMEVNSKYKDILTEIGISKNYYENGVIESVKNFEKGILIGDYQEWYENGNQKLKGIYIINNDSLDSTLKINDYWSKENIKKVINGNGDYEENNFYNSSFGKVKNGYKEGNWEGKSEKFNYTYKENYTDGKLTTGISIDNLGIEHIYSVIFLRPEPKNGLGSFYKYLAKKFKIPKDLEDVSGKVIVQFSIDKTGKVGDCKILKSINSSLDNEAIRLINNYPNWRIGQIRGINVKTTYAIPIVIKAEID